VSSEPRTFEGSCHCAAVGFRFHTARAVRAWSVRACACGFCRAHAALTTSDPLGRLLFRVHEASALQRYRFGLRTADFLLCRHCGVYLGAQIESDRGGFGIINLRALSGPPLELPPAIAADYGDENGPARIARREARWTPLERVL
jgi:hypothetical protein